MVEQSTKAADYLNITADKLHIYIVSVFPYGYEISKQDNAPCNWARIVLECFHEYYTKFQLMFSPPNSMDLNLIEHIW